MSENHRDMMLLAFRMKQVEDTRRIRIMEFKEASAFQEALERLERRVTPKSFDALEELRNACEIAASDANLAERPIMLAQKPRSRRLPPESRF